MAATRAGLAAACSSPSFRRDWRSSPPNSRSNGISFPTRRSALHSEQAQTTTTTTSSVSQNRRLEKMNGAETIPRPLVDPDFSEVERASLKDYFEQSKDLIRSDGGPPRWFSPLESGSQLKNSPLLLFLPGVDGVGLGLIRHHQRLGKIFDIWCLHIPVMDRTPFTDLVELVERTIRSENYRSPNRPIYLVGESLGGCLALAVASRNSTMDLVLILANPATSFTKSPLQPLIPLLEVMPDQLYQNFPYTLSLIGGDPFRIAMASMEKRLSIQQTIGELSEGLVALSSHLSVLADILPRETLLWKLQMLKSASAIANSRIHAVRAQTLILSSERDQFLPSQGEGERLCCALPNCELRKFDGIGHFLFLEDGFDLATIIKSVSFYRRGKYHDYVSDYMPPTPSEFKQAAELSRWVGGATSPVMLSTLEDGRVVRGLAGIPTEGPVLLVGNHMLLGSEVTWLVPMFLAERNIIVRGMAHPLLFLKDGGLSDITPYDIVRLMGGVPVSGNNLYKLLSSKSHVLLYPGGVREALHRKGEEYKLFWPEQSEFVRMAAKFEAKIIPFGAVGEDDIGEVVFDYNDQMKIPYLRAVIEEQTTNSVKLRTDSNGEVANQGMHLPGILPKLPGRFYFRFGKPIETEGWKHELRDREKCQELYLQVKSEVESCMDYLRERRERDPYRNILARVLYQATQGSTSEIPTFEF